MLSPGDVVLVDFPGATGVKRRPAVVLSTTVYHTWRPDVIVGLLTTQTAKATAPTDCILEDWSTAGLQRPSAFRSYLVTLTDSSISPIGHLSTGDWESVLSALASALPLSVPPENA